MVINPKSVIGEEQMAERNGNTQALSEVLAVIRERQSGILRKEKADVR